MERTVLLTVLVIVLVAVLEFKGRVVPRACPTSVFRTKVAFFKAV